MVIRSGRHQWQRWQLPKRWVPSQFLSGVVVLGAVVPDNELPHHFVPDNELPGSTVAANNVSVVSDFACDDNRSTKYHGFQWRRSLRDAAALGGYQRLALCPLEYEYDDEEDVDGIDAASRRCAGSCRC